MSTRKWGRALRRTATVVAGTAVLTMVGASVALAEVSPSPVTADSTTLYWSGQGSDANFQLCGTSADPGAGGFQNGANANDYMLWIFSTDGGSVSAPPTLTVNGTQYGSAYQPKASDNQYGYPGAWQIVTPYTDPGTIQQGDGGGAYATFKVNTVKSGSWVLTISHGCSGNNSPPPAAPLTVSKDAAGGYNTAYKWDIAKSVADPSTVNVNPNGSATFNYTVTVHHDAGTTSDVGVNGTIDVANPNGAPVILSNVSDQLSDGTVCNVDTSGGLTVPANGDLKLPYSCSLGAVPSDPLTNTVTVNWADQTLSNGLQLAADHADHTTGTISFSQNVTGDSVHVTDTMGGDLGTVKVGGDNPKSFTYPVTISGSDLPQAGNCKSYDNTASFTSNSGQTGDASQTVKVCVGADLTVSKTANPSFDRTYQWNITKAVDKTTVKQVGGTVTANYTVNASQAGFSDGNWQVQGKVTVTNPNSWEDITLTGLQDPSTTNGGTCTFAKDPTGTVIPAGQSVDFPYTCTYSQAPSAADGSNTATATWDATAAFTSHGSAVGSKGFTFGDPANRINQNITVTDTFNNGSPVQLGTLTATDAQPFASATYNYSHTVNVPASDCLSFPNTARIVETGQQADAGFKVCGPAKTGALTMGYWQNKNGQLQITGADQTALGNYLKGYAPFANLTTPISTYVSNVIKAANASGASMNAMLKAQMLSTALDVYFTGGLSGSVGSFNMDLTKVYTISGNYVNVSGAFGGATSMKVSDMLTYAAGQSNVGGSTWYGQVKAQQELAKDAFDAINNQWAFGV
jgi:hypothetical protein